MLHSASQYLIGLDDVIVHRATATDIREVFKQHFLEIYDLWSKEKCNILYCDLDVVFLKPAEFFNQFEFFSMFNLTDPVRTTDDHYKLTLEYFFNCGIRYYPSTMKQEVWDLGLNMLDNWNPHRWDCEQVIYNNMMWNQGIEPQAVYRPELSFQMLHSDPMHQVNTNFNQMPVTDACAVHVHGSRGSADRLAVMRTLASGDILKQTITL